ncbi:MAG: hypothetical protein M8357_11435 [Desulfobulbaceae bacterium]|nr:hypothetical protein [Desulfobulbaceae bacterium]
MNNPCAPGEFPENRQTISLQSYHNMPCRPLLRLSPLVILALMLGLQSPCFAENSQLRDASWQKTYEIYRNVPCLTRDELEFGAEVIAGLSYTSSRVFRKLIPMKGMNFAKSKEAWARLISLNLSYEQALVFEEWSDLDHIHIDLALAALPEIKSLNYEAGKSFRNYCALPRISPDHALKTIPLINRLNDAQNRALQHLLALPEVEAGQALEGLGIIARLNFHQAIAVESLEKVPGITVDRVIDALPLIRMLNMENAWNARTLFSVDSITPDKAWFWLVAFLATPTEIQEKQFHTLNDHDKETLVRAFYEGGEELIWKINNLHGVTDRFGFEISNHTLFNFPVQRIRELFAELSPQVKSAFADRFHRTADKKTIIPILKQAIAAERVATARRLTTPNIYALLAQGSELYDSSFRDILVPVLKKEIDNSFAGNLLDFLQATDPANLLVSNFIVSLAQKGKLTAFFPANSKEQEQILDLVAGSAFEDEDAIILFSATLMHLLEVLEPGARSFLVGRMSRQADEGSAAYSRLITVILQYYLEEYPELLNNSDRSMIARLIVRRGAVNLLDYLSTPFAQWKEDGALSSLSVFHPDDDGRNSFHSNAKILMDSGYTLLFSDLFTVTPMTDQAREIARQRIRTAASNPGKGLSDLFLNMQRQRFAVSFTRTVNGMTINHAAYVYSDEQNQELLLERFILGGTEMFAQRGHSYWRSEQITEPMEKLLQQGRLNDNDLRAKQRFLSLGSCGGVKAYTRLNQMFLGHVDILATIGSGLAAINNPYNKNFFEVIASTPSTITWKDMTRELAFVFQGGHGRDYLQPGSLPAILHKMLDEEKKRANDSSSRQNIMSSIADPTG